MGASSPNRASCCELRADLSSSRVPLDSLGFHKVGNSDDHTPAMTLHVYIPPPKSCRVWLANHATLGEAPLPLSLTPLASVPCFTSTASFRHSPLIRAHVRGDAGEALTVPVCLFSAYGRRINHSSEQPGGASLTGP